MFCSNNLQLEGCLLPKLPASDLQLNNNPRAGLLLRWNTTDLPLDVPWSFNIPTTLLLWLLDCWLLEKQQI
jgi:hypothetical protein